LVPQPLDEKFCSDFHALFWTQLPVELLKAGLQYSNSEMWRRYVINGIEMKQKQKTNQNNKKILNLTHSEK